MLEVQWGALADKVDQLRAYSGTFDLAFSNIQGNGTGWCTPSVNTSSFTLQAGDEVALRVRQSST
jgi:hypothetical protein